MEQKTTTSYIGDTKIKFVSDYFAGEYTDTAVFIGDEYLCTVSGGKRAAFFEKLEKLVAEYRI